MNLIFGTAGFAKEVDWLVHDIFKTTGLDYRSDLFVAADEDELIGNSINSCHIVSESEVFARFNAIEVNAFIAVGSPKIKEKIVNKIKIKLPQCKFPNLIHPDVTFDDRLGKLIMGEGNIICSKNVLTTDITLGNFVHINLDCTIGHDSVIGDFVTISPGVHVSGNVVIEKGVFIGTGAVIIERLNICSDTILGASSTLTKNISVPGLYVGIPARKAKQA